MNRYICLHGHFYQPPRENPWLEEVEMQDSSYPYHDWNSRITAECYAPNAVSRILDPDRRIIDIVNNYSKISFNFGPTLLLWMKRHAPRIYQKILDADKEGQRRFGGHGTALAQVYNHIIMPLASDRDKRTQIVWGIKDFELRFKRKPEGMWLPESAADSRTLEIMAQEGILFTILSPYQAKRIRPLGGDDASWQDVSGGRIDPKQAYAVRLPSGKSIAVFFYDGPVAHEAAFGSLLSDGGQFARRLISLFDNDGGHPQLAHAATDGETYGHHHRFGEMALAYCLYRIEHEQGVRLTVYGEFLAQHPPRQEAQIYENSSWSCIHGLGRWMSDCGCNSGGSPGRHQKWRRPLRDALDWLRDTLAQVYEKESQGLLREAWQARDDYAGVIADRSCAGVERFWAAHLAKELPPADKVRVMKLLEMQRHALLMYTSCGWFFDDISGIETVQILKYAARAIQLAQELTGLALEETFVKFLERAPGNLPDLADGARVYEVLVKPSVLDFLRLGAHYGVSSLFHEYRDRAHIYSYGVAVKRYHAFESGKHKLAIGAVDVRSDITHETAAVSFSVMHFGDHNIIAAAGEFTGDDDFPLKVSEMQQAFLRGEIPEVVRLMQKHFRHAGYSLWHLFKDEQRKVVHQIFDVALREVDASFARIYADHASIMQAAENLKVPLPKPFASAAEYMLNKQIREALEARDLHLEKLSAAVEDIRKFSLTLDKTTIGFIAGRKITALMEKFAEDLEDISLLERIIHILKIVESLALDLELWKAQNLYFFIGKQRLDLMRQKARAGDEAARRWETLFAALGGYLRVRIA